MLLDLYKCHLEDPEQFIAYHRGHDRYHSNSRYNKIHINSRPLIAVIDALKEKEYIKTASGFIDRLRGGARLSRMRATPKLITFVNQCTDDGIPAEAPPHVIYCHPDEEVIILKDSDKNLKEYEDTAETIRMREELRAYNELLERTFIDIDLVGYPESIKDGIDTTNKQVHRIFNNGSFDQGGRFYGGWWQNVKKDLRKRIMMGETDKPTIEIDYKALHINLLYNLVGIDYFETYGEDADPYTIEEYSDISLKEQWRSFYKLVLLTCVNAKSPLSATRAMRKRVKNEYDRMGSRFPPNITYRDIVVAVRAFGTQHAPIKRFFFTGVGLELQNIDSKIAEKVIRHFVSEMLPVLCMHDSFICTTRDSNHLEDVIKSAMQETIRELGGSWGSCPITPLYKTTDRRRERQVPEECSLVSSELIEEIFEELSANGSYEPRIAKWRQHRTQEIIKYLI